MTYASATPPSPGEDLRLATVFGVLGAIAVALLFPYLLATMPATLEAAMAKTGTTLPVLVVAQAAQGLVLVGLLAYVGLRVGHRVGLGAPWLRALVMRRPRPRQAWLRAAALGAAAGVAILGLAPLFDAAMPANLQATPTAGAARASLAGLLASFYGGIAEEVMLRLFLMTLATWLLARLAGRPKPAVLWAAIVLAALLFGAGHLPAAAKIWPLDAVVVARTLLLNGVGGIVFGWLYWRQGFESAVVAHFSADLVLHVAAPLLLASLA